MHDVTHVKCFMDMPDMSPFSGAENHLFTLMEGQKKAGLDVELAMIGYYFNRELTEKKQELERAGIAVHPFHLKPTSNKIFHQASELRLVTELIKFFKTRRGRIIHTHLDVAGRVGRIAARLAGCPDIVISFHNDSPHFATPRWKAELKLLDLLTARSIAISGAVENHLVKNVGLTAGKVKTVYYGVKIPNPPRAPKLIRAEYGIPQDGFVAGFAGRLHEQKDVPVFIEALERLPEVHGVIVGGGGLDGELRALVSRKGLSNVQFLGFRPDAVEIMSCFDVFCLPSRWEGLGLVLIEAMLQKTPIIGSSAGAIPEVLGHGRYGFIFDVGNIAKLAELIDSVRRNPAEAKEISRRAYNYARETFTVDSMIAKTNAVYDEAVSLRKMRT